MAAPQIDQMPEYPNPNDPDKKRFNSMAYNFVKYLRDVFVGQINLLVEWMNNNVNVRQPIEFTGTEMDLSGEYTGGYIRATNADEKTINVLPESMVPQQDGAQFTIVNRGAGDLTIAAGDGVTIYSNVILATDASCVLQRIDVDTYDLLPTGGEYLSDLTALEAEIDLKSPINSPAFTGNPTAPTPPANDNDDNIATTAYVQTELLDRPQTIESVTTLNAYAPTVGQVVNLVSYHAGLGKGGSHLEAKAGVITPNNVTTFASATAGVYFERINTAINSDHAGIVPSVVDNTKFDAFSAACAQLGILMSFTAGTFLLTGNRSIPIGCRGIIGQGPNSTIISAGSQSGSLESISIYNSSNIRIENLTFIAADINTVNSPLVFCANINNLRINNCEFLNTGGQAIGNNGVSDGIVQNCYFENTGFGSLTPPYGSAPAIFVSLTCTNYRIVNNKFKNTNWSASYFFAQSGLIHGNECDGCRESTFYCEGANNIRITNNKIRCGAGVNIANFGIEYGQGSNWVILGNQIEGGQDAAIGITNAANFVLSNNICYNSGKGMGAVTYASAGILLREFASSGNSSRNGIISGNRCYDNQGVQTQRYGMSFYVDTGAAPIRDIVVTDNQLRSNRDAPMYIDNDITLTSDTCIFRNNLGYAEAPKTLKFDIAAGVTGLQTFSGFGFKPREIRIQAMPTAVGDSWLDVTIVPNAGTADTKGFSYYSTAQHYVTFVDLKTPAGALALAADWTGGSTTTKDGFKLNYVNNNTAHTLIITCSP